MDENDKEVCERIIGECFQSLDKLQENHKSSEELVEAVFDALQLKAHWTRPRSSAYMA